MVFGWTLKIICAIVAGILIALSFPKYDLYLLAWIAMVPLLYCLSGTTFWQACLLGFICGFIFNVFSFSWFFSDFLLKYSRLPVLLNLLTFLALNSYLAAYFGVFAGMVAVLERTLRWPAYLLSPCIFVLLEYVRAHAFTGLPWELLGYSQYRFLHVIQIADITGVYGVSFLIVLSNAFIVISLRERRLFTAATKTAGICACGLVGLTIMYGYVKMSRTVDKGHSIQVALVQSNISMVAKLSSDGKTQQGIIDVHGRMTTEALNRQPDLIIWPETSMPFIFSLHREATESLLKFQQGIGVPLLAGLIWSEITPSDKPKYYNSALLIADGKLQGAYRKMKLVPFGEYVPGWVNTGKLIDNYDFDSGKEHTVFEVDRVKFSPLICYEIIFPEIARSKIIRGAQALIAVSNDAWFGDTAAPYQHFSMAVFRAVENRVPLVRLANTGISGFIDKYGMIQRKSNAFSAEILYGELTPGEGNSFYTRHGDVFVVLCLSAFGLSWLLLNYHYKDVS